MLSIFLGPDDFTKIQYAEEQAKKAQASLEVLVAPETLPSSLLSGADLFGGRKIFVIKEGLKLISTQNLPALISSPNNIFFFEDKVDKRLKSTKDLLHHASVTVTEFPLPHDRELNVWIANRVKQLGGKFSTAAVEALAVRLGRDEAKETKFGGKVVDVTEVYSLWQADMELQKLLSYAGETEVGVEAVTSLVSEHKEADVLDIVNAIGEKKKEKAFELVTVFLKEQTASDEKGKVIQLNALLSEQFRNVALVQDFVMHSTSEADILAETGWKSGRLFVIKKIAAQFAQAKVLQFLSKLSALDEELKSSQIPPKVLLDLILVQLVA